MLEWLFHRVSGYVKFEVEPASSRFVNMAVKSGITLWGFERKGDKLIAFTRAREYKKLRPLCRRCSVSLRQISKGGLPFYTAEIWKRKGLVIGLGAAVFIFAFMSSFVWNVQVSGIDNLTEARVLGAAENYGVYVGALRNNFDTSEAAQGIMQQIDDVTFVSVNTSGCAVTIEIKEAAEKPEINSNDKPSNLVAETEGKIISIEAQAGMPRVSIGDTVIKGQLLISGVYTDDIEANPYVQKSTPLETTLVTARGSVIAETIREFSVIATGEKEVEYEKSRNINKNLMFFGLKIPLGFNTIPDEEYRVYYEKDMLNLLDKELPIGIIKEKYITVGTEIKKLNQDEMKEQALYMLREQQNSILGETAEIVEEELEYEFVDNTCILTAKCICNEEITEAQEILFE